MALIEDELADWLLTELPGTLTSTNLKVGTKTGTPVKQAVIFNLGGDSEWRMRFRILTRGATYTEAMELANSIYDVLQRAHRQNFTTYKLWYCDGQRPQFTGLEETGSFLVSADFVMEFVEL